MFEYIKSLLQKNNDDNDKFVISFQLTEEQFEHINTIKNKLGMESRVDLFNNALTLFEWCLEETHKGRYIASVNNEDEDDIRELDMSILNGR